MFGNDAQKVKDIEAKLDWLITCACIVMAKIGQLFHLNFPPEPTNGGQPPNP